MYQILYKTNMKYLHMREAINSHFPKMGTFSSEFAFLWTYSFENISTEQRQIKTAFYGYATLRDVYKSTPRMVSSTYNKQEWTIN